MARLFDTGIFSANATDGSVGIGYNLNFYVTGTSTRKATYPTRADAIAATNANPNPVPSAADGRFPPIWLTSGDYKCVLTDATGTVLGTPKDPADTNLDASSLDFMQSGTGVVSRSIQDRLRDIVSVKDFGAVGDGTTDDTAAIQAALDSGKDLFWPAPAVAYRATGTLYIRHGQRLYGTGATPHVGAPGTIGSGSWIHLDHTGKGFIVQGAGRLSGVTFERLGTFRNQPVPAPGWTPNAHDYDIWIDDADVTLRDVTLLNPTYGVYLTNGLMGRLTIDNLRGQAFKNMLRINESYDVVRINALQCWPFWADNTDVHAYTRQNLDMIYLERCDNPKFSNIFGFAIKSGIRFEENAAGRTAKLQAVNCGFDSAKYGILVGNTMTTDGVTGDFTNLYYHADGALTEGNGIEVNGDLNRLNFVNYTCSASPKRGVLVGGAGNVLTFSGGVRVTGYNLAGGTFAAFEVGANNNVFINSLPTIFSGNGGPRYGGSGVIYVDEWRADTPVPTAGTGSFTSAAANARYKIWNNTCDFIANIIITTNGTAASDVRLPLPIVSAAAGVAAPATGESIAVGFKALKGLVGIGSSQVIVQNYDNTYPGATGETMVVRATYPIDAVN